MKNKKLLLWIMSAVLLAIGGLVYFAISEDFKSGKNSQLFIPEISKELISQKIEQGKEFLFRAENKETGGFYKKYDALNDDFGKQVHTVYSASAVYTLLNIYEFDKDQRIPDGIDRWTDFLLSMQNSDKKDKRYGAFSYSYDLEKKEKEKKYVVGTAALSTLTLLKLYETDNNSEYLEASKLAGDWLTTMQEEDGGMKQYSRYDENKKKWVSVAKESFLYDGQVLTALSRLYRKTGEKKYYFSAEKIALRLAELYEEKKGYIVDEVRPENPISNSWVVMSLMEFYKNASQDKRYKNIVFELGDKILANQKKNSDNLLVYGMWKGAYSTSGVGWISEVMAETHKFCKEENRPDCDKYKEAVFLAAKWLFQNTYSKENSSFLPNSEMAEGGIFWNENNRYVRIDSNCHALNSYLAIVNN
ncbi:MAG: hypothetical protein CEN87_544 [Parcubacteria group bacterium Licking1014_1]|nr:MAG: hypothetical protein CEN87_544 [Parcubacteria group bacterium Licking1014_1]